MKYELQLPKRLAGFVASVPENNMVSVVQSAFLTDSDGEFFYSCLDGFESNFLQPYLEARNRTSSIDHFLILIEKSLRTQVFINELPMIMEIIAKKDKKAGEAIFNSDIAGIRRLRLGELTIPRDVALIMYFSVSWRRGLFFDLRPLHSEIELGEIEHKLAFCYEILTFHEIYTLEAQLWDRLYALGWFPFIAFLGEKNFKNLIITMRENEPLERSEQRLIDAFDSTRAEQMLTSWKRNSIFSPHLPFIEKGIEHFRKGEWLSANSVLYPRIEGLLRFAYSGTLRRPNQLDLIENLQSYLDSNYLTPGIYLPQNFKTYILRYYFKDFDFSKKHLEISRHSLAHGVAEASSFDKKHALIAILILDQLHYYFSMEAVSTHNHTL